MIRIAPNSILFSGLEDPSVDSSGSAPARRLARASPPRPSTRPRIVDGLGHQLGQLGPDGQPAADLLEDLGGIPTAPGANGPGRTMRYAPGPPRDRHAPHRFAFGTASG